MASALPGRAFEIQIPEGELGDLRARLRATRWPDESVPNDDWSYGANTGYVRSLALFWVTMDWRAQERYLNGGFGCNAAHRRLRLPSHADNPGAGLDLHFVYAASTAPPGSPPPIPLLLLHGWPGSFFEFHRAFAPLTKAGFTVVCPSLPGFGFSDKPKVPGFGTFAMAQTVDLLMRSLGFENGYVAQGGDWGGVICRSLGQLASADPASCRCRAVHMNMITATMPARDELMEMVGDFDDFDRAGLARSMAYLKTDAGYSKIQGTKPQTIGTALDDSPAGLLAWIVEKLDRWSDSPRGAPPFSKAEIITNVMVYWMGRAATSSARLYFEAYSFGQGESRARPATKQLEKAVVTIPVGFAMFPKEISWPPAAVTQKSYSDIRRMSRFDKGGHFAAWEVPEVLVAEITAFFKQDVDAAALCGSRTLSRL